MFKNHEKYLEYLRRYYKAHRQKCIESSRRYYEAHKQEWAEYHQKRMREFRRRIFEKLGGKCVRCGFSDVRALQIDHVHGGGTKEYRELKGVKMLYRKVLADAEGKYQLLCANCNWIKKVENNENIGRVATESLIITKVE